jgi:hypothetical protein
VYGVNVYIIAKTEIHEVSVSICFFISEARVKPFNINIKFSDIDSDIRIVQCPYTVILNRHKYRPTSSCGRIETCINIHNYSLNITNQLISTNKFL